MIYPTHGNSVVWKIRAPIKGSKGGGEISPLTLSGLNLLSPKQCPPNEAQDYYPYITQLQQYCIDRDRDQGSQIHLATPHPDQLVIKQINCLIQLSTPDRHNRKIVKSDKARTTAMVRKALDSFRESITSQFRFRAPSALSLFRPFTKQQKCNSGTKRGLNGTIV